jgi:hypothetical protein
MLRRSSFLACLGVTLFECGEASPHSVVSSLSEARTTRNNRQRRSIAALKKSYNQSRSRNKKERRRIAALKKSHTVKQQQARHSAQAVA